MHKDHQAIRDLAYRLWEERGRPDGCADQDWLTAEGRLSSTSGVMPTSGAAGPTTETPGSAPAPSDAAVDEALVETFPASDPAPASHGDAPPANAGDKWKAARGSRKRKPDPANRV